jgi:2-polyprenyl-3-methyl-5-hydroxy-6-metoxy-1,4-benzoquinol methylase
MNLRDQMEEIYRDLPAERIPWNLQQPPDLLVDLVHTGKIQPCDAVDIGCGAGNYAVWLAALGFRMTGIDISPTALELAGQLARHEGVACRFLEEDITRDAGRHVNAFDFGYDWELLHHVFPEQRDTYASNVGRMLRPGATHLSVCFSDRDRDFGGTGKYRKTPLGTTLYFSSEAEIERLFIAKFRILELDTAEIVGKYGAHTAVVALLECK